MLLRSLVLALFAFVCAVLTQKASESKGSPEMTMPLYASPEAEVIARVESQLLNALSMLETLQDEPKIAEKRRNKFEFIRFGRK